MANEKIILEVGLDDLTSYFSTTVEAIKEAIKLPVKERWDALHKNCEDARIHSDNEIDFFLDLSSFEDDDDDGAEVWLGQAYLTIGPGVKNMGATYAHGVNVAKWVKEYKKVMEE